MDLNYAGKLKEYKVRCGQNGLSMQYEEGLKTPYASIDGRGNKGITLPLPNPQMDKQDWIVWDYMAEHELGHLMPGAIDTYDVLREKKIAAGTFIASMNNLSEDFRQEWLGYYDFEGRRQRLNAGRALFLDRQEDEKLGAADADEKMMAFQAMYTWDTLCRESWMPACIGQGEKKLNHMTDQQLDWIEKLRSGDYESTLKSGLGAYELYDFVKRVINEVFEFDADEEEKKAQDEQAKSEQAGEDGEEESDGDGSDDDSEGEICDGEEGNASSGSVKYSDLLAHSHGEIQDAPEDSTSYSSLRIKYDTEDGDFEPRNPLDYKFLDYVSGDQVVDNHYKNTYKREMMAHAGDGLAKHVRRLLQVRSQASYQHGRKRGKISPKSIYRGGMIGIPSEKRVFKKKITNTVLDTAVFVLCDMSGSMGGDKLTNAGISCKLLNAAIGSINIPLEIAGFDDHYGEVQHALWKSFSKSVTSEDLIERISDSVHRQMSCNSDGESIMWAYHRLTQRKESRKILIVLSDGSPASSGNGDAMAYTKKVVASIEATGIAEIYGIGIEDRNVNLIYKDNVTIQQAAELEKALLNVIEKKILS